MITVTIIGRAGRDPEVKYFESGTVVAKLSIASRGFKRDDTTWMDLEIWGKQAQVAADYVRKGHLIGVTGSIKSEKWTDKNSGQERSKLIVNVSNLELLQSKDRSEDEEVPF
jgi:single-strand DNA-binding protein